MSATARHGLVGLAACLALLAAGCGSTDGGSTASPGPAASSATPAPSQSASGGSSASSSTVLTIKDYKYDVPDSVKPGTKLTIKNEDPVAHTVTADKGGFEANVPANGTATITAPAGAGTYAFHCMYHANMMATLKVG